MKTLDIHKKKLLFISVLMMLTSCSQEKSNEEIFEIIHGKSFGMCEGYCYKTVKYDSVGIIKYSHSWRNEKPDKHDTLDYSNFKWIDLSKAINIDSIKKLPPIIGCPDCADGGAEWIEIKTIDSTYRVEFDYNSEIDGIKRLLNLLRKK